MDEQRARQEMEEMRKRWNRLYDERETLIGQVKQKEKELCELETRVNSLTSALQRIDESMEELEERMAAEEIEPPRRTVILPGQTSLVPGLELEPTEE